MLQAKSLWLFLRRAAGIATAGALLWGCYAGLLHWKQRRDDTGPAAPRPATPVAAVPAIRGPLPATLDGIGTLKAVRQVTLAPEVGGAITALHFESGGRVEAGAPILQLNDAPERGDLERFRGLLVAADREHQRTRRLLANSSVSVTEADAAEGRLREVKGQVARTEAVIAQKRLLAPFAGVLGVRKVNLGEYLQPGQPVVTLTDLDTLHVDFTLPEQALTRLKPGLPLELSVDAHRGRAFAAAITTIEPQVYSETRTVLVQGTLDNRDRLLQPGMFAAVRVILPPEPDVVTIPETALDRTVAGDSVYLVREADSGRVAERVPIKAGRRIDGRVAILDGVRAGDLVVTSGQINLAPGSPVAVKGPDAGSGANAPEGEPSAPAGGGRS